MNNSGMNPFPVPFFRERDFQLMRQANVGHPGLDFNKQALNQADFDQARAQFNSYSQILPISKEYWDQAPLHAKLVTLNKGPRSEVVDSSSAPQKNIAMGTAEQTAEGSSAKSNVKNTYINKINTLIQEKSKKDDSERNIHNNPLIKNESEFMGNGGNPFKKKAFSYDCLRPEEMEKMNEKLVRNRESARNTRKRKKVYIELLERKVEQLNQALDQTKNQIGAQSKPVTNATALSKGTQDFINGKQQVYEKLEKMLQSESDDSEISFLIDSLRFRLGANCKDRVQTINNSYKEILELIYPPHLKNLLASAEEKKGLFAESEEETKFGNSNEKAAEELDSHPEILASLNATPHQREELSKYSNKLRQQKEKFENAIEGLQNSRKVVTKLASSFQTTIDDLRKVLTPTQIGKFLIIIDKKKEKPGFGDQNSYVLEGVKQSARYEESENPDVLAESLDQSSSDSLYEKSMLEFDFLKEIPIDGARKNYHQGGEV